MKMYTYEVTTNDPSQVIAPYAVGITITTKETLYYSEDDLERMDTNAEEIGKLVAVEIEELRSEEDKIENEIGKRRRFL